MSIVQLRVGHDDRVVINFDIFPKFFILYEAGQLEYGIAGVNRFCRFAGGVDFSGI